MFSLSTIPNYHSKLENLRRPKSAQTVERIQEKSARHLEKIAQVIDIQSDDIAFIDSIKHAFKEISLLKPGRALLKQLTQALKDKKLAIGDSSKREEKGIKFSHLENKVWLSVHNHIYYAPGGIAKQLPFSAVFAHELLHVIHYHENPKMYAIDGKQPNRQVLHPHFDDIEEQRTIIGLRYLDEEFTLCENAMLHAMQRDLRTAHRGLELFGAPQELRLDHLICAYAYEDVKKHLAHHPADLNRLYRLDWKGVLSPTDSLATKCLLPLTLALIEDCDEIIDFLVSQPLQLDLIDDRGGPIVEAFNQRKCLFGWKLFTSALEKGHPLNLELLLDHLLKMRYYPQKHPLMSDEEDTSHYFYDVLFKIGELLEKQSTDKMVSPFIQRMADLPTTENMHILINWLQKKTPSELQKVDAAGNNLLMIVLQLIKDPKNKDIEEYLKYFFKKLKKSNSFDFSHRNHQGKTLLTLAQELGLSELI